MPLLSVFFIRTALIYLALGFTYGGLMLFSKGVPFIPSWWNLMPAHIEFLLFGWTIQLILGVAFWILPRFSHGSVRGKEEIAWISYVFFNAGIWIALLSPLFHELQWLTLIGRLLEVGAAAAFVAYAWSRVKPVGA